MNDEAMLTSSETGSEDPILIARIPIRTRRTGLRLLQRPRVNVRTPVLLDDALLRPTAALHHRFAPSPALLTSIRKTKDRSFWRENCILSITKITSCPPGQYVVSDY